MSAKRWACSKNRLVKIALLISFNLVLLISLSACGVHFVQQQANESRVNIIAVTTKNLNRYKSSSHPLVVEIYQLKNLDQLRLLPAQLEFSELKRLISEKIRHLAVNSQTLLPDSAKKLQLSTQKNCRYLVILAGYYDLPQRDDYMAIYPIADFRRSILRIEYGVPITPEIYIRFGERKII